MNEGEKEYRKGDFRTEGVKVKCRDDELVAKLHRNKADVHFFLGKITFLYFYIV